MGRDKINLLYIVLPKVALRAVLYGFLRARVASKVKPKCSYKANTILQLKITCDWNLTKKITPI